MLFPTDYSKDEQYPLIIVLHGTGERGDDNSAQLTYGGTFFVGDAIRSNYPAIVIFPQCPSGVRWDNKDESTSPWTWNYKSEEGTAPTELLLLLIKDLVKQGIVDSSQLYIGGISMGAMGAYEVAYRLPDYFAAGFFMSGGGNPNDIANVLSDMSFRIMHGDSDTVVAYSYATDMYDTLTAADITCKLDTYEGVGHSGWSTMFAEPDFMSWLWTYTK
ncbi:MAG: PHB depolymerase family esterase [Rikenellaceae bacterium]